MLQYFPELCSSHSAICRIPEIQSFENRLQTYSLTELSVCKNFFHFRSRVTKSFPFNAGDQNSLCFVLGIRKFFRQSRGLSLA